MYVRIHIKLKEKSFLL